MHRPPLLPPQELHETLQEAQRMLEIVRPHDAASSDYREALTRLATSPRLQATSDHATHDDFSNFSTRNFEATLMSARTPASWSGSIDFAVDLSALASNTPWMQSAAVIHGAASLYSASMKASFLLATDTSRGSPLETRQFSTVFCTQRLAGATKDSLIKKPDSNHITVWSRGYAYALNILDSNHSPCGIREIAEILAKIDLHSSNMPVLHDSVARLTSNINRTSWSEIRGSLLDVEGNTSAFESLESGILTVALEGYEAPTGIAQWLHDIKMNPNSLNRYGDLTTGLILYRNEKAGFFFDHIGVDGGIAHAVVESILQLAKSTSITNKEPDGVAEFKYLPINCNSTTMTIPAPPSLMAHKFAHIAMPEAAHHQGSIRTHAFMSLVTQLALFKTFGTFEGHQCLEPVSIRHFEAGRVVTTYSTTRESLALVQILALGEKAPTTAVSSFLTARSDVIKLRKRGACPGSHFSVLRGVVDKMMEEDPANVDAAIVSRVWKALNTVGQCWITGYDDNDPDGSLVAAMGNLFMPQQLSVMYVGMRSVMLVASGDYATRLEELVANFHWASSQIGQI
ncbi:hypothetical protein BC830DRAFT_1150785 [Chytriomyces sp. MP71]|nr:hypothetical protein BC830DRAFT_1150785 [Chytriomyces sp. MP71]